MFRVTVLESHRSQAKGNSYQYFHMPASADCPPGWRNKAFPWKTAELWTWYGPSINIPTCHFQKNSKLWPGFKCKRKDKKFFFSWFYLFSDGVGRCLWASIGVANKKKTAVGQIRCGAADGHRPYHPHIYLSLNLTFNFITFNFLARFTIFSQLRLAALSPSTSLSSPRKIILRTWEILKSSPPKESASIRAGIWPNLKIF